MQVMQPLDQNSIRIERFLNGNSYQIILLKNTVIVVRIINNESYALPSDVRFA